MTQPTAKAAAAQIGPQMCGYCMGKGAIEGWRPHTDELGNTSMRAYAESCFWCNGKGLLTPARIATILTGRRAKMLRIRMSWTWAEAADAWGIPTVKCAECGGLGGYGRRGGKRWRPCLSCGEAGRVSPAYTLFEDGYPLPSELQPTKAPDLAQQPARKLA